MKAALCRFAGRSAPAQDGPGTPWRAACPGEDACCSRRLHLRPRRMPCRAADAAAVRGDSDDPATAAATTGRRRPELPAARCRFCPPADIRSAGASRSASAETVSDRGSSQCPSASPPSFRSTARRPCCPNCIDGSSALEQIGRPFEIILVEDCGGDDSWSVIEQLAAADPVRARPAPGAQLRPAQCPALRHPRGAAGTRRDPGRRSAESAGKRSIACWPDWMKATTSSTVRHRPRRTVFSATRPRGSPSSHCGAMGVDSASKGERVPRLPRPPARGLRGLP